MSGELSDRRDGTAIPFGTAPAVHVDVTDAGAGLDLVRFFVDDQLTDAATGPCTGCALEADFALPANLLLGQHQIKIQATDLQGATTEQAWTITVGPPVLPLAAPTRAQIAADGTAPTAEIVATGAQWDRLRALLRVTDDLRLSKVEVTVRDPNGSTTLDTITCDSTDCTDRPDHTIHYERTLPNGGPLGVYTVTACAYDVATTKTCDGPSEQQVPIIKAAPAANARLRLVVIDRPGGNFPEDNRPDTDGKMLDANIANRSVSKAASLGANGVVSEARWHEIATSRPTSGGNPPDAAYTATINGASVPRWRPIDLLVQQTTIRGMTTQLNIWGTPDWAGDQDQPAPTGKFNAFARVPGNDYQDLYRFAFAVQQRYSGWFPESLDGALGKHLLPRVSRYVAWNEPNSQAFLFPQYRKVSDNPNRFVAVAPRFFAGIASRIVQGLDRGAKAAQLKPFEQPLVGVAGLQVFGKGEDRSERREPRSIRPRTFIRALRATLPAGIDAFAYHPYPVRAPDR